MSEQVCLSFNAVNDAFARDGLMERIHADVAIIGAGGAGLRAAITLAQTDPSLRIALISKVYPMRSHTCAAEGGAAGVIKSDDSLEQHFNDTVGGGDWLCDQDAVEYFVREAPRELIQLEHWGCPWNREPDGSVAVRPFGGMKIRRTWFAADKSGFHILHTLFQTSLQFPSIQRYDEYYATDLLVEDGRCRGLTAIEMRSGQLRCFDARAVIVASGGAGRMFPFTTNGAIKTGDGMALAYRAGVPLKDMEFVQYHPTGLPNTGILLTEACRGEGGVLLNKHGRRFLQDYGMGPETPLGKPQLKTMELGPRDRVSQAFWQDERKGNMLDTRWGRCMLLDMRHLGERIINERLPFVRELSTSYLNVDPVTDPVPVRPVVHYMMGGIHTDSKARTPLPGLYAAGECACVSINGANRLGSNSLVEILVFGRLAALNAIEYLQSRASAGEPAHEQLAATAQARLRELFDRPLGKETVAGLRQEMMDTMEKHAGIYRTGDDLAEGMRKLSGMRRRYREVGLHDKSNVYNTDLLQALELGCMLDCAEAVMAGAAARRESRGAHQRLDYTERDDANFLRHTLAYYAGEPPPRLDYLDVVITQSQPGVRDYSGAHAGASVGLAS
jgi:fumarate reductase flavoprotein subunit